jgi:hypothetical protein
MTDPAQRVVARTHSRRSSAVVEHEDLTPSLAGDVDGGALSGYKSISTSTDTEPAGATPYMSTPGRGEWHGMAQRHGRAVLRMG